jgi:hypothetical protein
MIDEQKRWGNGKLWRGIMQKAELKQKMGRIICALFSSCRIILIASFSSHHSHRIILIASFSSHHSHRIILIASFSLMVQLPLNWIMEGESAESTSRR